MLISTHPGIDSLSLSTRSAWSKGGALSTTTQYDCARLTLFRLVLFAKVLNFGMVELCSGACAGTCPGDLTSMPQLPWHRGQGWAPKGCLLDCLKCPSSTFLVSCAVSQAANNATTCTLPNHAHGFLPSVTMFVASQLDLPCWPVSCLTIRFYHFTVRELVVRWSSWRVAVQCRVESSLGQSWFLFLSRTPPSLYRLLETAQ